MLYWQQKEWGLSGFVQNVSVLNFHPSLGFVSYIDARRQSSIFSSELAMFALSRSVLAFVKWMVANDFRMKSGVYKYLTGLSRRELGQVQEMEKGKTLLHLPAIVFSRRFVSIAVISFKLTSFSTDGISCGKFLIVTSSHCTTQGIFTRWKCANNRASWGNKPQT